MALGEDLRASIIKQFPADVVLMEEKNGSTYYACPTCKHQVLLNTEKCTSCDQVLKWDNVKQEEAKECGVKTAVLTFEVPGNFSRFDCRKCPLSYIARVEGSNAYECPLNMRNNCPLEFVEKE